MTGRTRRSFVVVSGPPGSGKSTLAVELASALNLPLVSKDLMKESLMNLTRVENIEDSRRIGVQAIEQMCKEAAQSTIGAVIDSTFHRSFAMSDIDDLPGEVVEVFCQCRRETSISRYRTRSTTQDRGHLDSERTDDELWNCEVSVPIAGGWPVIVANTEMLVDVERLAATVASHLDPRPDGS